MMMLSHGKVVSPSSKTVRKCPVIAVSVSTVTLRVNDSAYLETARARVVISALADTR